MAMTPQGSDLAAGVNLAGSFVPFQLFAGEKEIVTDHDPVAANQTIAKYQVLAKDASGNLIVWDGSTGTPIGVAAQPITTTTAGPSLPYYISAFFNHEALVWPNAINTIALRKKAFQGTEIRIGTLYGAELPTT